MIIHEMAHVITAILQKKNLVSVKVLPIGLNAVVEGESSRDINSLLLNISGPVANLLLFAACFVIDTYYLGFSDNMRFFIYTNISLAVFNMLPVLPLDGGRILKDILVSKIGFFRGYKYVKRLSLGFALALIVLGVLQSLGSINNFSFVLIAGYMIYLLKNDETEVSLMNIKNLLYKRSRFLKRGIYPGRELVVLKSMRLGDMVKNMDFDRFHIIYVVDEDMRMAKVFTEQEVIDSLIKYNAEMTFDDLIKSLT